MHPSIEEKLEAIRADRESGAAELARQGVELMRAACALAGDLPESEAAPQMAQAARALREVRPSMAAPGNWALAFLGEVDARMRDGLPLPAAGERAAAVLLKNQDWMQTALLEQARGLLGETETILALSYSSTIAAVLLQAAPPSARFIVAESRPLLEGRKLAGRIMESGREVRIITDAQIALAMGEADTLLLGADTICRDAAAVNKIGSHGAALAAQARGKPCFVCADTFKVSGTLAADEIIYEAGPGAEVWEEYPGQCANTYFEAVPADLIACFVTEKGILSHADIRAEAARWRRLEERFFPAP